MIIKKPENTSFELNLWSYNKSRNLTKILPKMITKNHNINFNCWAIKQLCTKEQWLLTSWTLPALKKRRPQNQFSSGSAVSKVTVKMCQRYYFAQISQWSEIFAKALYEILSCTLTWIIQPKVNNGCMTKIVNELQGKSAFQHEKLYQKVENWEW